MATRVLPPDWSFASAHVLSVRCPGCRERSIEVWGPRAGRAVSADGAVLGEIRCTAPPGCGWAGEVSIEGWSHGKLPAVFPAAGFVRM